MKNYIIYKITNKLNGYIYIGCHVTENINDRYMGSGTNIKSIIKQQGKVNFTKEILFIFDNLQDMFNKEKELVNKEFIARQDTYNIILGGGTFLTTDTVSVKDKDGNYFRVHKTDLRWLSGELIGCTTGYANVIDYNGNTFQVNTSDLNYINGIYSGVTKNTLTVKDKDNNTFKVDVADSKYLSGELVPYSKNKIVAKDKEGKLYHIDNTDSRWLSGELVGLTKGDNGKFKHSELTKQKMSLTKILNKTNIGKKLEQCVKDKISSSNKNNPLLKKIFYVYDLSGKLISTEKGIIEYAKLNKLNKLKIYDVLKGRLNSYRNLIYSYNNVSKA